MLAKRWIIKTAIQHVISWLPASHKWNELLQRHVTKGLELAPAEFAGKLHCCRKHVEFYQRHSPLVPKEFTALELGTGWFPIVPVGLYLCGASEIWSYDLVPLMRSDTFRRMVERFCQFHDSGELSRILPWVKPERLARLRKMLASTDGRSPESLLNDLNIHARIGDARRTELAAGSVDLVFSTVCFEHISRDVLGGLLAEFRRVCSKNAVMTHYIGLADQFASFDRSITPFNFLRYRENQWRWLNNRMIPLSRLRIPEYRRLVREAGFSIVEEENALGRVEDLRQIPLAPEFQEISEADLLVLFSWLAAKPS